MRAVPFVRRHAARVAAIEFAAFREEIWKCRRARLLIESNLTGVGISGRAAPLAATSAAVVVEGAALEACAGACRSAILWRRRRRQDGADFLRRHALIAHINAMRKRPSRTALVQFLCMLALASTLSDACRLYQRRTRISVLNLTNAPVTAGQR